MENLSLEGLTPEQIKLLESVADGFRVAKKEEPVVVESSKDKAPKFYRIISTCWYRADDMETGVEIDFIAKIRSDDPNSLECISSDTGFFDFDTLKSYIEENGFNLKWYSSCENPQWAGMDSGTRFYTDVEEITEEEYNDSDKWKDADVEYTRAKFKIVSSGFTQILTD